MNPSRVIHVLHVAKTAGSALKRVAQAINRQQSGVRFMIYGHRKTLDDLPHGSEYVFATRDPVTRFRSAFLSRQRKGRPLYDLPWNELEGRIFSAFNSPDELAGVLFSGGELSELANEGMRHVPHFKFQARYTDGVPDFLETRPPLSILRQERFNDDLNQLLLTLGICAVEVDQIVSQRIHANTYQPRHTLSAHSESNLRRWYASDYEYIERCNDWINSNPWATIPVQRGPIADGL